MLHLTKAYLLLHCITEIHIMSTHLHTVYQRQKLLSEGCDSLIHTDNKWISGIAYVDFAKSAKKKNKKKKKKIERTAAAIVNQNETEEFTLSFGKKAL